MRRHSVIWVFLCLIVLTGCGSIKENRQNGQENIPEADSMEQEPQLSYEVPVSMPGILVAVSYTHLDVYKRQTLGAVQNRLEHTINNLDNVVENTTSAESQIRDTDMATEMVKYSNNNILSQAGQAMLAQSNQANQGVLSLLQ